MSDRPIDLSLYRDRRGEFQQARSRSQYAQLRLTVTFGPGGRADYRAMTKAPHEAWQETCCFAQGYDQFGTYPPDFHEALRYFALVAEGLRWMPDERD